MRGRSLSASAVVLIGLLVLGLGAVLCPDVDRAGGLGAAGGFDSEHASVDSGSLVSEDVDTHVPAAPTAPTRAQGERRVALAPGPATEVVEDAILEDAILEAGALEVVVRQADRAAVGRVALQRIETNDLATPFDPSLTIEAPLEGGVARFANLPQGVLLVGVFVGAEPPLRTTWVNSRVRGARLEFALGRARLHGWVRGADGAAADGARVWITGRQGTVVATCASDGSYDGGGVHPGGRCTVHVEGDPIALASPRRTIDLVPNSVREVSFGPGGDLSRWTGRVLAPDGSFVTAKDGLPARAVQVVAREGRGATIDVRVVDGAIDQWFERDVYALRLAGVEEPSGSARFDELLAKSPRRGKQGARAMFDLSSDLVRDVQLVGFVLTGRVELGGSEATGGESPFVELRAAREFEGLRAEVDAHGSFRFVGVEAGTHALRSSDGREESIAIDARGPIVVDVERVLASTRD